jgi:hypothetical protein
MSNERSSNGRPEEVIAVRRLRDGGPSMKVPGDGGVRKPPGEVPSNSAVHAGDVMAPWGGPASPPKDGR